MILESMGIRRKSRNTVNIQGLLISMLCADRKEVGPQQRCLLPEATCSYRARHGDVHVPPWNHNPVHRQNRLLIGKGLPENVFETGLFLIMGFRVKCPEVFILDRAHRTNHVCKYNGWKGFGWFKSVGLGWLVRTLLALHYISGGYIESNEDLTSLSIHIWRSAQLSLDGRLHNSLWPLLQL